MTKKAQTDKFANLAYGFVLESGANTITFSEIQTGVSIFEKIAWIIHRILWFPYYSSMNLMLDSGDQIQMALVVNSKMTSLGLDDPSLLDLHIAGLGNVGVAASGFPVACPVVHEFNNLPGGGIIVPPKPLYVAAMGVSLASAVSVACRIEYTHKALATEDYWELVEARRIVM